MIKDRLQISVWASILGENWEIKSRLQSCFTGSTCREKILSFFSLLESTFFMKSPQIWPFTKDEETLIRGRWLLGAPGKPPWTKAACASGLVSLLAWEPRVGALPVHSGSSTSAHGPVSHSSFDSHRQPRNKTSLRIFRLFLQGWQQRLWWMLDWAVNTMD